MQQATVITGAEATRRYQFIAQKHAVKLEGLGMRHSSGRSVLAHVKRTYGIVGNRAAVIATMEQMLATGQV